jgi:hypothetical protein
MNVNPIISNPFGTSMGLGWLSLPATVVWIIVITKAVSLIEGARMGQPSLAAIDV